MQVAELKKQWPVCIYYYYYIAVRILELLNNFVTEALEYKAGFYLYALLCVP